MKPRWLIVEVLTLCFILGALRWPAMGARWTLNRAMLHVLAWASTVQTPCQDMRADAQTGWELLSALRRLCPNELLSRHDLYRMRLKTYLDLAAQRAKYEYLRKQEQAGTELLAEGNRKEAASIFRNIIQSAPRWIEAYGGLYQCLHVLGEQGEAESVLAELADLRPMYRLGQETAERWQEVDSIEVWPGWHLLGYDIRNEEDLAYSSSLDIVLYWEVSGSAPHEGIQVSLQGPWKVIAVEQRIYQIGVVENLVPNPGFERFNWLGQRRVPGWPFEKYSTAWEQRIGVSTVERDEIPTAVLELENFTGSSGVTTDWLLMPSQGPYLQGGWLYSESDARLCLGRAWAPHLSNEERWYSYVLCNRPLTPGWLHVAGIAVPLPEAAEVKVWALNLGRGQGLFDNLVLFPLEQPALP